MKLRNKKTGEIATKIDVSQDNESFWVLGNKPRMYSSLAELNEEWEDGDVHIKEEIVAGIKEVIKKVSALDSELGELLVAALTDYVCYEKGMFNGKPCKYAKQYRYAKSEKGKEAKRRYYQKHKEEIKRKRVAKNGKS